MGQQRVSNITLINSVVNNDMDRIIDIFGRRNGRQPFLLTCFMSWYDRFISKNIIISYGGLCYCMVWPSFLLNCFVKIWATCENFLGKWFTAPPPTPLAKNCPYAYEKGALEEIVQLLTSGIPLLTCYVKSPFYQLLSSICDLTAKYWEKSDGSGPKGGSIFCPHPF